MKNFWTIIFFIACLQVEAQQTSDIVKSFDSVVNTGGNYQEYKVIKKVNLNDFKKNLASRRDSLVSTINGLKSNLNSFEKDIKDIQKENKSLNDELIELKKTKDQISLLGIDMSKSSYQLTVWGIIFVLILILAFLFIKYRNRNIVTSELQENLSHTNKEFEEYKLRAIEKQQKLGRDLLDAQKKVQTKNRKS